MDTDQIGGPDLDPNCLQGLTLHSVNDKLIMSSLMSSYFNVRWFFVPEIC